MFGGSSKEKGVGASREKEGRKGKRTPFTYEGSLDPDFWEEAIDQFSLEGKSDFAREAPLKGYDDPKEDRSKCMHGEDCVVQMMAEGIDGSRRFFKCLHAWVIALTCRVLHMSSIQSI